MSILNEGKHTDVIEWLPDGNGFVIKDKKKCLEQVLSVYFGLSKYPSFTRRMKRWAFVHHQRGHKTACYFHPYFSRQNPSMCLEMKCNPQKKYGARSKTSRREQMFQNRSMMYPSNNHNMHQRRQHQALFASNAHPKMPPLQSNKFETSVYPSIPNTSTQFSPSQVFHSGGMQAVSQEQQFTAGPHLYTDGFSQQNTSYLPNASMPQPSSYAPVNMHQAPTMNANQHHQSHLNTQHQQQINQQMHQTYQHPAAKKNHQQMDIYRQNQQQPNPASMSNQSISSIENHIPQPPPAPAIYSPVMRTLGQNQQFHVPAAMNVSDGSQTNPGGLAYQQHQTHNYGRTDVTGLQNDISSLQMPQNPIQASQRPGPGINISPSSGMNSYANYANHQQQQQQLQQQRQMNMGNDFNSQQQMQPNYYRYS